MHAVLQAEVRFGGEDIESTLAELIGEGEGASPLSTDEGVWLLLGEPVQRMSPAYLPIPGILESKDTGGAIRRINRALRLEGVAAPDGYAWSAQWLSGCGLPDGEVTWPLNDGARCVSVSDVLRRMHPSLRLLFYVCCGRDLCRCSARV